jgi:hypothetical protein
MFPPTPLGPIRFQDQWGEWTNVHWFESVEVVRLCRVVDLGGFIPCPDHRIAPDAKWENVQYYTDRLRRALG